METIPLPGSVMGSVSLMNFGVCLEGLERIPVSHQSVRLPEIHGVAAATEGLRPFC